MMFAKLFGTDKDQVLVMLVDDDEGNPTVRTSVQPEGMGVCSVASGFSDDDEGWAKAEKMFAAMTEAKAQKVANSLRDECRRMMVADE